MFIGERVNVALDFGNDKDEEVNVHVDGQEKEEKEEEDDEEEEEEDEDEEEEDDDEDEDEDQDEEEEPNLVSATSSPSLHAWTPESNRPMTRRSPLDPLRQEEITEVRVRTL